MGRFNTIMTWEDAGTKVDLGMYSGTGSLQFLLSFTHGVAL
jgi:hypothetical protein